MSDETDDWPPSIFYTSEFLYGDLVPLAKAVQNGEPLPTKTGRPGNASQFFFDCLGGILQIWLRKLPKADDRRRLAGAIVDHHTHFSNKQNSSDPPRLTIWLVDTWQYRHYSYPSGVGMLDTSQWLAKVKEGDMVLLRMHRPEDGEKIVAVGQFLHALLVTHEQKDNLLGKTKVMAQAKDLWDPGHFSGEKYWAGELSARVKDAVDEWFKEPRHRLLRGWVVHVWIIRPPYDSHGLMSRVKTFGASSSSSS